MALWSVSNSIQTGLCTKLEGPVPTVCGGRYSWRDCRHCEGISVVQREGREDCQSAGWEEGGEGEEPRTPWLGRGGCRYCYRDLWQSPGQFSHSEGPSSRGRDARAGSWEAPGRTRSGGTHWPERAASAWWGTDCRYWTRNCCYHCRRHPAAPSSPTQKAETELVMFLQQTDMSSLHTD